MTEAPEYVMLEKPYLLLSQPESGITEAIGLPADYTEISRFKSSAQLMIEQGSPLNRYDLPPDLALASDLVALDRRVMIVQSQSGTTATLAASGTAVPTIAGAATTLADSTGGYTNYASGAALNASASLNGTAITTTTRQWGATCLLIIKTGANATDIDVDTRTWAGLASSALAASDDLAGASLAAFRYSPVVDATVFWRCCTKDAVTQKVTVTTTAIAANTRYLLKIVFSATDVKFYIDNVLVATHTTELPALTTTIGFYQSITNLNATARNFRIGRWYMDEV